MKSRDRAEEVAEMLWNKNGKSYHVVFSEGEKDIAGNDYHVCTDADLDTFYLGCPILVSYEF